MLYIAETPIHFGIFVVISVILLLMSLLGILEVLKSETPSAGGFSGFLAVFFGFLAFFVMAISVYQLPASATVDQLLPYYLATWSLVGLHAFFLVFYLIGFKWFKKRQWAVYLPIIGNLSYLAVLWIFATPSTASVISDGVFNWLVMPLVVYAYGGFLAIFYLLLVPLIAVIDIVKTREGAKKTWTWVGWFGLLLWFITVVLMALVQFIAPFMLIVLGIVVVAWVLIFLSWFFIARPVG